MMQEWAAALNAWLDRQLDEFVAQPGWSTSKAGVRTRGGAGLIEYGTPASSTSVVYYNPFKDGNPHQAPEAIQTFLYNSGIRRVLSGHQPHGQSPTIVRQACTGILFVTCDTSR